MALSNDLIKQFAKLTNNNQKEDTGTEIKGTFVTVGNKEYVRLDGSDILTPVSTAIEAVADERVVVLIKDHMAEVVKNITSPAARSKSVSDLKNTVDEQGNSILQMDNTIVQQGNSIIQMNNNITQMDNTITQYGNVINQQGDSIVSLNNTVVQQGNTISSMNNTIIEQGNSITSMNNTIKQQGDNINSMNNVITAHGNSITQMNNTITQQGNQISQFGDEIESQNNKITAQDNKIEQIGDTVVSQGNTIQQMGNEILSQGNQIIQISDDVASYDNIIRQQGNQITLLDNTVTAQGNTITAQGSNITILNSGFKIVNGQLTGLSSAIIEALKTDELDAVYAEIDFANIEIAAVEKLFTESGIIKDLVIQEGHITGELVGVTIKGDLIEAGTLVADKLVIKGEDGLYYKLNTTGETVEAQQTDENSLSGSVITAKSITASKVTVDDLVAFGATIAGFIIDNNSIHSDTKGSIDSNANGLYMDKVGQFYIGDLDNHIKYYIDEDGNYKLNITANSIYMSASGSKTIIEAIDDVNSTVTDITQNIESMSEGINEDLEEINSRIDDTNTNIDTTTNVIFQTIEETNAELELTKDSFTTRIEEVNETVLQNASDIYDANELSDVRYRETQQAISEVEQTTTQITNIFQLTGGTNLIKNSVWYYQTDGIPNDWYISPNTSYMGGNDDELVGIAVSRGFIKIQNGSVQTANGNIINILENTPLALSFKYNNGLYATSKLEVFDTLDIDTKEPIWSMDFTENTDGEWIHVQDHLVSTSSVYIIRLTSETEIGTGAFMITDLMFNYGEVKPWELSSGEVFGSVIKLSNQGIQVTSNTANTETFMMTDGISVFNKQTGERVTKLTDSGIDTEGIHIERDFIFRKLKYNVIKNTNNMDIYVEYFED